MDPKLYTAAMKDDLEVLKPYSADQFALQVTPNGNTVLHVAAAFGSRKCVEYILSKCDPSLLHRVNADGDTPIHVALAREREYVLSLLIKFAKSEGGGGAAQVKEILRARNHDGDTPFHLAARSSYMIDYFLELVLTEEENPGFDHGPNKAGETPAYLYVKWGYNVETLHKLLKTCTLLECGGPKGRTALHAVVMYHEDKFLDELMEWNKDLIKEQDTYGRTPLHYAARNGDNEAVQKLLDKDESVAYVIADNDQGNTALHIASAGGHKKVMEVILLKCPDCWEMVNSKRQNILHISAYMKRDEVTEYIFNQKWAIDLVNRKDHEGNTPMHVIAKGDEDLFFRFYGIYWEVSNNEGLTPLDIIRPKIRGRENWLLQKRFLRKLDKIKKEKTTRETRPGNEAPGAGEGKKGKGPDQIDLATFLRETAEHKAAEDSGKMTDTHMIVATLISTMSFTAGFTIPGGYHQDTDPNKGTAVLVREAAFKAFVITNTIAVVCSTSSVFLYVSASLFNTSGPEGKRRARRHAIAFGLIIAAMLAMTVAFSTGAYTVLSHSLCLAIVTCVIGCSSSIVYAVELKKHFTEEIEDFVDSLRSFGGDVLDFLSACVEFVGDACGECTSNLVSGVIGLLHRVTRRGALLGDNAQDAQDQSPSLRT